MAKSREFRKLLQQQRSPSTAKPAPTPTKSNDREQRIAAIVGTKEGTPCLVSEKTRLLQRLSASPSRPSLSHRRSSRCHRTRRSIAKLSAY